MVKDHQSHLGVERALFWQILDGDRTAGPVDGVVTEAAVRFESDGPKVAFSDFEGTRFAYYATDVTCLMINTTYCENISQRSNLLV